MTYQTYYARIPISLHELIKDTSGPRGGRKFALKVLSEFVDTSPWKDFTHWFPATVPDGRNASGRAAGIVQMNLDVPLDLSKRLDQAILQTGASKAAFLLGALLWMMHTKRHDERQAILEISRQVNFIPLAAPDTLIRGEVKKKPAPVKKETRDWRDASQDRYGVPCAAGNSTEIPRILANEQRDGASNSISEGDIFRAAQELVETLKPYGKDADGARTLVFPPSLAASQVLRERGTVAVLSMDSGAAKLVQCYRANLRAGEKARQLYLPPLVHARRGQQEAQTAALSETKHLGHLKSKFAYEPMAFWVGYLLESVLAERMTTDRAGKAANYYAERSVRHHEDFRAFCKDHLPSMLQGFRPLTELNGATNVLFQQLCDEVQKFYGDQAWSVFQPNSDLKNRN